MIGAPTSTNEPAPTRAPKVLRATLSSPWSVRCEQLPPCSQDRVGTPVVEPKVLVASANALPHPYLGPVSAHA